MKTIYQYLHKIAYHIFIFYWSSGKKAIHVGLEILKYLENKIKQQEE